MSNARYQTTSLEDPPFNDDNTETAVPKFLEKFASKQGTPTGQIQKSASLICNSVGGTLFLLITSALPIAMMVIGALNKDKCEIERFIPLWLIVFGACSVSLQFLKAIVNIIVYIKRRNNPDFELTSMNCFTGILTLFLFGWFIAGNVWVYSVYPRVLYNPTPDVTRWCDRTCYLFAFWSITAQWILFALIFCCCGCVTLSILAGLTFGIRN